MENIAVPLPVTCMTPLLNNRVAMAGLMTLTGVDPVSLLSSSSSVVSYQGHDELSCTVPPHLSRIRCLFFSPFLDDSVKPMTELSHVSPGCPLSISTALQGVLGTYEH